MNAAVVMLQKLSEKKVSQLIVFQSIGLIMGVILLCISIIQIFGIVKNLLQSSDTAKGLSRGDLTNRFDTADKPKEKLDELGFLGYNLNTFTLSLQGNIKNIFQKAQTLSSSSAEMSKVAAELSKETNSSAEKTINVANTSVMSVEIAGNVNEVSLSISQISSNSNNIASSSEQLSQLADQLHEMVNHFTIE